MKFFIENHDHITQIINDLPMFKQLGVTDIIINCIQPMSNNVFTRIPNSLQPLAPIIGCTQVGSEDDLTSLCKEASKHDINIICTVVLDYLGPCIPQEIITKEKLIEYINSKINANPFNVAKWKSNQYNYETEINWEMVRPKRNRTSIMSLSRQSVLRLDARSFFPKVKLTSNSVMQKHKIFLEGLSRCGVKGIFISNLELFPLTYLNNIPPKLFIITESDCVNFVTIPNNVYCITSTSVTTITYIEDDPFTNQRIIRVDKVLPVFDIVRSQCHILMNKECEQIKQYRKDKYLHKDIWLLNKLRSPFNLKYDTDLFTTHPMQNIALIFEGEGFILLNNSDASVKLTSNNFQIPKVIGDGNLYNNYPTISTHNIFILSLHSTPKRKSIFSSRKSITNFLFKGRNNSKVLNAEDLKYTGFYYINNFEMELKSRDFMCFFNKN